MIFIYTTCADKKEAKSIAKTLIEEKMISGANFWDCESAYASDNGAAEAKECAFVCQTEDMLYGNVKERINELHSYKLPIISSIDVEMNEEYVFWMEKYLK